MEWTREKTMCLINEYRKRRGLWDMTHDDYRKKEVKQKLLVEVSASLGGGIPIVEIEKKFHTLRTQYHREINRMKRKEPYNSKWFGFKNLQFLSSPKACRSSKGRIKSEITEEGTVTTKYIIREAVPQQDTSGGSPNSSNNLSEEFVTIQRKPTVVYEVGSGSAGTASTSRSRELEKLIEETTKDVEEIEEAKPKITTIKEIGVPIDPHAYTTAVSGSGDEMTGTDHHDPLQDPDQQQQMEEDDPDIEAIDIHTAEDEIIYQTASSTSSMGGGNMHHNHHHQAMPTRIIKIQRRDTCQEDDYHFGDEHQQQPHQQQHHLHAMPTKRIYYESNGHQHTATLLTTPLSAPAANSTLLNSVAKIHHQPQQQHPQSNRNTSNHHTTKSLSSSPTLLQSRDEFSTYGEYVANEMRGIANREILVALKHKINTALFEASMAELQK